MEIFRYGQTEIDHLKHRDKKLGAAIEVIGVIKRETRPDPFAALVMSVVAQQISNKAANTIRGRLHTLLKNIIPERIAEADISQMQKCGLSVRKIEYIKGIAAAAMRDEINCSGFQEMTDEDIIRQLSSLRGIGAWTVEMLLLFSLCRPDIVSWGDQARYDESVRAQEADERSV